MKKQMMPLLLAGMAMLAGVGELRSQAILTNNIQEHRGKLSIHPRALKDFSKKYTALSIEKWSALSNGFLASYNLNEIKYTVFYDRSGHWTGSLKNYKEDKLPYKLKEMVKNEYSRYSIFYVAEIETPESIDIPIYLIYLEGMKDYKVIEICDGQMDIKTSFQKS